MLNVRRFFMKLRNFLRREQAEQELNREVRSHLDLIEHDLQRRGMSPDEARLAAKRAFGGVEKAKEMQREERSFLWLEQAWSDVLYGLRSLRRNRSFTLVATLSLAAGIGVNTLIFSVVNSTLLKPMGY